MQFLITASGSDSQQRQVHRSTLNARVARIRRPPYLTAIALIHLSECPFLPSLFLSPETDDFQTASPDLPGGGRPLRSQTEGRRGQRAGGMHHQEQKRRHADDALHRQAHRWNQIRLQVSACDTGISIWASYIQRHICCGPKWVTMVRVVGDLVLGEVV